MMLVRKVTMSLTALTLVLEVFSRKLMTRQFAGRARRHACSVRSRLAQRLPWLAWASLCTRTIQGAWKMMGQHRPVQIGLALVLVLALDGATAKASQPACKPPKVLQAGSCVYADEAPQNARPLPVEKKAIAKGHKKARNVPDGRTGQAMDDSLRIGEYTLADFEDALFDERAELLQQEESKKRQSMIKQVEELLARNPRYELRDELYFRLGEYWWEETRYRYLLERREYGRRRLECRQVKCIPEPEAPTQWQIKAVGAYELLVRDFPQHARIDEALYRLGRAALMLGKARRDRVLTNRGVQYLNQLNQKHHDSKYMAETLLALAEHFFEGNNLTLAKMYNERITQSFKSSPMYTYALYKLGWVYYNLREFRRTIEMFQAVVMPVSGEKTMVDLRVRALKDLEQAFAELEGGATGDTGWREAKDYYGKVENDDKMWNHLERMASLYLGTGKEDEALSIFAHFIEKKPLDPRCVDWWESILIVRKKIGNMTDMAQATREFADFFNEAAPWHAANKNNEEHVAKARRLVRFYSPSSP